MAFAPVVTPVSLVLFGEQPVAIERMNVRPGLPVPASRVSCGSEVPTNEHEACDGLMPQAGLNAAGGCLPNTGHPGAAVFEKAPVCSTSWCACV